jgi:DNA-binding transcriptional LysR family regulator
LTLRGFSPTGSAQIDIERIELRLLRYFLAVVEELHFGRAAQRLHMSQPPLSQAIRKLEDRLGVDLFERTSRGVTLTDAGRAFAVEARKVLAGVDLAIAEARRAAGAGSPLRIGCTLHFPLEPLHRFLVALEERDLASSPELIRMPPIGQLRLLRTGQLDLGIFPNAGPYEGIETEPLVPGEPLAAYLHRDHRLSASETIAPTDLEAESVVVAQSANPALWETVRERFEDAGYRFDDLHDVVSSNDGRDALLAAAAGSGIALLPASMLESTNGAESVVVRRPLDPAVSMPDMVVGWRAKPSRQLAAVLASVREIAREMREADREVASA